MQICFICLETFCLCFWQCAAEAGLGCPPGRVGLIWEMLFTLVPHLPRSHVDQTPRIPFLSRFNLTFGPKHLSSGEEWLHSQFVFKLNWFVAFIKKHNDQSLFCKEIGQVWIWLFLSHFHSLLPNQVLLVDHQPLPFIFSLDQHPFGWVNGCNWGFK